MRLCRFCRRENLDHTVDFAHLELRQRWRRDRHLMRDRGPLQGERRRVARAAQPALGRVQPQLAALMCADTGHRFQLCLGAMHEPVDRTQVECEGSALWKVDARADGPPCTRIGLEFGLGGRCRLLRHCRSEQIAADHQTGRRGGGRDRPADDDLAAARGPSGMADSRLSVGHLSGEPAMQIGDELLARGIAAQPRGPQLDGGLHLLGLEIVWASVLGALPPQQALDETAYGSVAHDVASSPDCAAMRSARYCNTFAFATLTPIWLAASRTEKACRKRSSRIRR